MATLTKKDLENLPNPNGNPQKEAARLYTELVFTGTPKRAAFEQAFPERVEELKEKFDIKYYPREVSRAISRVERNKFTQECFNIANKDWWTKFITKKQDIYSELYNTAMNPDEKTADRLNASKIFLAHVPDAPKEEVKVNVEVKVGSDEFKKMLDKKKRDLHTAANGDIIDITPEVEEITDDDNA